MSHLNVVKVSFDLQEFVCVFSTDALLLHHPALDAPRVVCPAVHSIFAHLVQVMQRGMPFVDRMDEVARQRA